MVKVTCLAAAIALAGATAQAGGCAPPDGIAVPELEALNQMVLDQDFTGLGKTIDEMTGMNVRGGLQGIGNVYADGFTGCTTIAQRSDVGGMVQSVVMFHGKAGPLFGYWRHAVVNGKFALLSFSMNNEMSQIMPNLY